jgi:hydroxyacyl-ACP dehydratase HTD2-like protein with hotdog domain
MNRSWIVAGGFSPVDLALFAGATWNPHLIHLNPEFARASGLGDLVVQSHLVPARLLALLDQDGRLHGQPRLRAASWRNRAPILANQEIIYSVRGSYDGGGFEWQARVGDVTAATGNFLIT